jgi:hypothetical protein
MSYTTYWSILDSPSHTTKSNSVCLIIAIGFALLWILIKKFRKNKGDGEKLILLWGTGVFAVLGLMIYFVLTFMYKDNSDAQISKMLDSPTVGKVEGIVSNFQRKYRHARYGDETIESFTVGSVQFAYGDALLGKFNSFSQTNNSILYNGRPVRVSYNPGSPYGANFNSILKLELGQ